jgi:hypothetical protein
MTSACIALCGAPLAGKRTVLEELGKQKGGKGVKVTELENGERLLRLEIFHELENGETLKIVLQSLGGHLFNERDAISHVFERACLCVYLFAYPTSAHDAEFQKYYLDIYREIAEESDITSEMPWVYVTGKIDLENRFPDNWQLIPNGAIGQSKISANDKKGLESMWRYLLGIIEEIIQNRKHSD